MLMSSACRFLLWAVLGILALNGCGGGGGESGGFFPSSPDYTPSCSGASPAWTSTPDYESVASCVSQASLGDTINITAGEARWSQRLEMGTKRLSVIGAGIGETVITASSDGLGLFDLGTGGSRLAHMTISNPGGAIYVGGGQGFIIDHLRYLSPVDASAKATIVINNNENDIHPTGVIYSNNFENVRIVIYGARQYYLSAGNSGNVLWSQTQPMGSDVNAIFVEGNAFLSNRSIGGNAMDSGPGGRYVFRYNTITSTSPNSNGGQYIEAHSIQGEIRGTHRWEIYNNVLDNQGGFTYYPFRLRGGTGLVANNSILGKWTNYGIALDNVRSYADYSGTHNGGSGLAYLSDSTASFTYSGWETGSLIKNVTAGSECLSTSRTPTTYTCTLTGGTRQVWNNRDAYRITRPALALIRPCDGLSSWDGNEDETGYPCRDQIGRGYDEVVWIDNPPAPYRQVLMPAYGWNNKRADGTTEVLFHVINDSERHIKANRDYYNYTSAFDGQSGVGRGALSARPSTCTINTAYFATDAGPMGTLYKCSSPNTWSLYFQPAPCPHPLAGSGSCNPDVAGRSGYTLD